MAILIDLGSLTMNSATPDLNGAVWKIQSFDGWEAPSVRQTTLELTGREGVALGESVYGPLFPTIEGTCVTPSWTACCASMARLRAAVTPSAAVFLTVHELPTAQRAIVYLAGAIRMKIMPGAKHFRFLVPLIAPDPTKVGV